MNLNLAFSFVVLEEDIDVFDDGSSQLASQLHLAKMQVRLQCFQQLT